MPKSIQGSQGSYSNKPYKNSGNKVQSSNKSIRNQKTPQPPNSLSACKKQIRDVSRLLNREGLPSTARVELERRLKALNIQQTQLTNSQKDKANASRYHMIKFFERKKIERMLKHIEKQFKQDISEKNQKKLLAQKQDLLISLNYTIYYPNEFKYMSLFPADPSSTTEDTTEKRESIRLSVKKAMEKGDLPKDPRDISVEERKAIRSGSKFMLRTVSNVHGKQGSNAESGAHSDASDNANGHDEHTSDAADSKDEEDEFFA